MPKAKKLRAPALDSQQVRHEPLGQVIEGDSQKGSKYAPSTGRRKRRKEDQAGDGEFLDEKTSRKILDMSREQQIEEEIDEQRLLHQKNQRQQQQQAQLNKGMLDDSDEEDDEEIEEISIDEVDDE
jgi:hypothetical protein